MKTKALAVTSKETTTIDQRRTAPGPTVPVESVGIKSCSHSEVRCGQSDTGPAARTSISLVGSGECALAELPVPTASHSSRIDGDPDELIVREIAEHPFGTPTYTGRSWPLADVRLLSPILASKVVCVGKNYADHIAEMGGTTVPRRRIR